MPNKKKVLATSRSEFAEILNALDGKGRGKGLTRKQYRDALKLAEVVEMACIKAGYRSVLLAMRKKCVAKASKLK